MTSDWADTATGRAILTVVAVIYETVLVVGAWRWRTRQPWGTAQLRPVSGPLLVLGLAADFFPLVLGAGVAFFSAR